MDFESPENESTTAGNQARINIKWTTGTLKLKRHPGGAGVLLSQAFCFFPDNRRKIWHGKCRAGRPDVTGKDYVLRISLLEINLETYVVFRARILVDSRGN